MPQDKGLLPPPTPQEKFRGPPASRGGHTPAGSVTDSMADLPAGGLRKAQIRGHHVSDPPGYPPARPHRLRCTAQLVPAAVAALAAVVAAAAAAATATAIFRVHYVRIVDVLGATQRARFHLWASSCTEIIETACHSHVRFGGLQVLSMLDVALIRRRSSSEVLLRRLNVPIGSGCPCFRSSSAPPTHPPTEWRASGVTL